MTRRAGETLTEYRDRRLESTSPSRYNSSGSSALEFQSRTDFGARESSAPASYLSRVNRLTDTSSSGTDGGGAGRRTSDAVNATPAGSSRRQKFKDSRAHTAELGALIESMDNQGRRGSGQDSLDGEVQWTPSDFFMKFWKNTISNLIRLGETDNRAGLEYVLSQYSTRSMVDHK